MHQSQTAAAVFAAVLSLSSLAWAAGGEGVAGGSHSFGNETISANVDAGEGGSRFTGISSTGEPTSVTVEDGAVLTVKGDAEELEAERVYGMSVQTGGEITVAGDLSVDLTSETSETQLRAVRVSGDSASGEGGRLDMQGDLTVKAEGAEGVVLTGLESWYGGDLHVTGDVTVDMTGRNGLRNGLQAAGGSLAVDGSVDVKIRSSGTDGDESNVSGMGINGINLQEGGSLRLTGSRISVSAETDGASIYAIRNYNNQGGEAQLQADEILISSVNDERQTSETYGILAYQSMTVLEGASRIEVSGNQGNSMGVMLQGDLSADEFDTVVEFRGDSTVSVKGPGDAYGAGTSGAPSTLIFGGAKNSVSAESQHGQATGILAQYSGTALVQGDMAVSAVSHEDGGALGVQVDNYAGYAGNVAFAGSLSVKASAENGAAYGLVNLAKKDQDPQEGDGILSVKGPADIQTSTTGAGDAFGIYADGDLAVVETGDLKISASSAKGSAYGVQAGAGASVSLSGASHQIEAAGDNGTAISVLDKGSLVLSGSTVAEGGSTGLDVEQGGTLTVKEDGSLLVSSMVNDGSITLEKGSWLAVKGKIGAELSTLAAEEGARSDLGDIHGTDSTVYVGAGSFRIDSFAGTDNELVIWNLDGLEELSVGSASDLTVTAAAAANDQYENVHEALEDLTGKVDVENGDDNVYVIEEGAVNDGIVAEENPDGSWTATVQTNEKIDSYGDLSSLGLLAWRSQTADLHSRMGELRDMPGAVGTWVRLYGSESSYGSVTAKQTTVQAGADRRIGPWTLGASYSYTDSSNELANGSSDDDLHTFSLYGTWMSESGLYADLTARYGLLSSDFTVEEMKGSSDRNAWSVQAELGWRFEPMSLAFIEPQVSLMAGQVLGDDFTTVNGVRVDHDDFTSVVARTGVRMGMKFPENAGSFWVRFTGAYDFEGESDADIRSVSGDAHRSVHDDLGGAWLEAAMGASFFVNDTTTVYVDLEKQTGGEVDEKWSWNVGLRKVW